MKLKKIFLFCSCAIKEILTLSYNPDQIAALEKELGLDKPWYEQYVNWLGSALTGDFGKSLRAPRPPVMNDIKERIGNTVELGILTVLKNYLTLE